MNERTRLVSLLAVFGVVIAGLIVFLGYPLWTGTDVVLKTLPVDPFDPIRGQYLTIRYEVSELPALPDTLAGETVYVKITPDAQGIWRADGASTEMPADGTYLRSTVERTDGETMYLVFGIEQYFFERNAEFNSTNLTVHARVASTGQARIVGSLHDGEPIVFE
jgi:uncharacterized membrane-anchored protein